MMQMEKEILVIDDDEVFLSLLETLLEHDGFKVYVCSNALNAVTLAKVCRFDFIIIDYRLADMKGDAITAAIRRMQPSAIIIGCSMESKEQAFLSAGANKFISKEELPAELIAYIREQRRHLG
jgi:DNA-binding response OmpR family regulator